MSHRVSFIIATRDERPDMLAATIRGIQATTPGRWREIVVVDDGSVVPVCYLDPEVTVLRNETTIGCCPSRRRGCESCSGDVFVILDPHMTFGPGWLEEMLVYVDSGSLLCSPWREYELSPVYSYGADFAWDGDKGLSFDYRPTKPKSLYHRVPMLIGACYMISRATYDFLGGFCPYLAIWGLDEQDLSARAWLAGLEVACVTRAQVGHWSSFGRTDSGPPLWRMPDGQNLANNLVLIRSVFESDTQEIFESWLEPRNPKAEEILAKLDLEWWRSVVQRSKVMSDSAFLQKFGQRLPERRRIPRTGPWSKSEVATGANLKWEFGINDEAFKSETVRCLGMSVNLNAEVAVFAKLLEHCPLPLEAVAHFEETISISMIRAHRGAIFEFDGRREFSQGDEPSVIKKFQDGLVSALSRIRGWAFFDAGVLEIDGEILLLLGEDSKTRESLVIDLVKRGANLLSGRYLVVNEAGEIHPFVLRGSSLHSAFRSVLRPKIRLVSRTHLEPGSHWTPIATRASRLLPDLAQTARLPKGGEQLVFKTIPTLWVGAKFLDGPRDCPAQTGRGLLEAFTSLQALG